MARKYEIYHSRQPLRFALKLLFSVVGAALLLAVIFFFWFQMYIVYTPDGVRLDIPFLDRNAVSESSVP